MTRTLCAALFVATLLGTGCSDPQHAAQLFDRRGPPTMFTVACGRYAYSAATDTFEPVLDIVRYDTWMYASGKKLDAFYLVNGEVVGSDTLPDDYSMYPNPELNPRQFGCSETPVIVQNVLQTEHETQLDLTTDGTSFMLDLRFGGQSQTTVEYYVVKERSGLVVTYANGRLISMVTM